MRTIKKFIVEIAYVKFEFDNDAEALAFAETALRTCTEDKTCKIFFVAEGEDADVC